MIRMPGPPRAVILAPEHVRRVLDESPEPFATASSQTRAALAHFEPRAVLISRGDERADRQLALLIGNAALAAFVRRGTVRLGTPVPLGPARPLPGTLNHAGLLLALNVGPREPHVTPRGTSASCGARFPAPRPRPRFPSNRHHHPSPGRRVPGRLPAPGQGEKRVSMRSFHLTSIGRVESPLTDPASAPRQADEDAPSAWLVFDPGMAEGLRSVRPGAEAILLTWLDRARRDVLSVHPRGDPTRSQEGVFSTRSPHRPNPIGLHRVLITAVEGCRVRVRSLEALDGTPILDLKPVLAEDLGLR